MEGTGSGDAFCPASLLRELEQESHAADSRELEEQALSAAGSSDLDAYLSREIDKHSDPALALSGER